MKNPLSIQQELAQLSAHICQESILTTVEIKKLNRKLFVKSFVQGVLIGTAIAAVGAVSYAAVAIITQETSE